MVRKEWIYEKGGRPVIYQSDDEFHQLPESIRYRHVRYEPSRGIDLTWEREWRIRIDDIALDPAFTTLVVPSRQWVEHFKEEQRFAAMMMGVGSQGLMGGQQLKWHFIALEDLGIDIEFVNPKDNPPVEDRSE